MKSIISIILFSLIITLDMPTAIYASENVSKNKPKYVFLFIGDGMGQEQVRLAEAVMGRKASFRSFPVKTLTTTKSANNQVTDSAAAGTAIACGTKTNNCVLGLSPDGQRLESVAVNAQQHGRKIGLITDVPLNHATPAAFYAHRKSRNMFDGITDDLLTSGFDFFAGDEITIKENSKYSKQSFSAALRKKGYYEITDMAGLKAIKPGGKYLVSRKGKQSHIMSLAKMLRTAIQSLDNPEGFFIMVEGGKIDWTCHENDAGSMVKAFESFDDAVKIALKFYSRHPNQCLIVVTADHETGGLKFDPARCKIEVVRKQLCDRTLFDTEKKDKDSPQNKLALRNFYTPLGISWSTRGHTGSKTMTYVKGFGSKAFDDIIDNTEIALTLRKLMSKKKSALVNYQQKSTNAIKAKGH